MHAGGVEVVNQRHHFVDAANGTVGGRVFAQAFLKLFVVACDQGLVVAAKTEPKASAKVIVVDRAI